MANITRRSPHSGDITRFDPFYNVEDWFKNFGMRPFSMEMENAPRSRWICPKAIRLIPCVLKSQE